MTLPLHPRATGPMMAATILALGVATATLGRSGLDPMIVNVVAVAVAAGLAVAWREVIRRFPPPPPPAADHRLRSVELSRHLGVGAVAWNDRLAALDPSFSVPVLSGALRALAGDPPGGPPQVEKVRFPEGEVVLTALIPGRPTSVRLTVSRPVGVPMPPPESVEHGWRLGSREVLTGEVEVRPPAPDPGMPSARRALLLRDPAFDADDFASYLRQVRDGLARGDSGDLDPQARADIAFYGVPAAAPSDAPLRWLEVELDGFHERVEVEHAGWWVSLLRRVGDVSAPWRVWRLVPLARGAQ